MAILAAGRGNRLSPLTDDLPKCLLGIGDTSALALALDTLDADPHVDHVFLVVGHQREKLRCYVDERASRVRVELIDNPRYDTANNIVSAYLLRDACPDGFLLFNSDVVCHSTILRGALAAPAANFLVIDSVRPVRDEAMKVRYGAGRLAAIGKSLDPGTADGEYVGIARFDREGARLFFQAIGAILDDGGSDEWYESAIARAAARVAFGRQTVGGLPWIEIDDPRDLERARSEILPRLDRSLAPADGRGPFASRRS